MKIQCKNLKISKIDSSSFLIYRLCTNRFHLIRTYQYMYNDQAFTPLGEAETTARHLLNLDTPFIPAQNTSAGYYILTLNNNDEYLPKMYKIVDYINFFSYQWPVLLIIILMN